MSASTMRARREMLGLAGRLVNDVISFVVFSFLDVLDMVLCLVYKILDFIIEAEWKHCYCSSPKEVIMSGGNILISKQGKSNIVRICSRNLQLEDASETLYKRSSVVSELAKATMKELVRTNRVEKVRKENGRTGITINSTIIEMLQGKRSGQHFNVLPRWSDCACKICTSWTSSPCKKSLFVRCQGPKDGDGAKEDVLFIHGFISSSAFWSETLFPNFSEGAKSRYRFIAVDLLGFGQSPKPTDSLYTMREHVDMIRRSVIEAYKVKSFHIVAHSLGCIVALAIAVEFPDAVKSLTLLAPGSFLFFGKWMRINPAFGINCDLPYFPVPEGVIGSQFVLRRVAPRHVWPLITFGASIACWYEHISRTICFLICKNHRLWESIIKLVTQNRVRTFLVETFCCHTHNAAWHTLHNIIFGSATKMDAYLDAVRENRSCKVTVFHGREDELLPVECSYALRIKIPRARVKVIEKTDHITLLVGRQKAFAGDLEEIWMNTGN